MSRDSNVHKSVMPLNPASWTSGGGKESKGRSLVAEAETVSVDIRGASGAKPMSYLDRTLAGALPRFSLDLVGVVKGYCLWASAWSGAVPERLFRISYPVSSCQPRSIASCRDGYIWIGDIHGRVNVFNPDGTLIGTAVGKEQITSSSSNIAFDANNNLYIGCRNGIVLCRADRNDFIRVRDFKFKPSVSRYEHHVASSGRGFIYVTDSGNNCVQAFKHDGTFAMVWGGAGSGDGQFKVPMGIAVSDTFQVYVVDWGNHRIQVACVSM
jgi:hypothetical protein